jgi:transketolase
MDIIKEGSDGAIIAYGGMIGRALEIHSSLALEGISMGVVNMPCVKEIDEEMMKSLLALPLIVTYEDHNVRTGIAPLITSYLLKHGYKGRMESFGIKNYGVSGDADEAYAAEGLDVDSMCAALLKLK